MNPLEQELSKARSLYTSGAHPEALNAYLEIADRHAHLTPAQSAEILTHCGWLYKEMGERDKAEESFRLLYREGLSKSQVYNQSTALYELGLLELDRRNWHEAVVFFRSQLNLLYSCMDHYFGLLARNYLAQGRAFLGLSDTTEAALYLRHAETFAETDGNAAIIGEALELQSQLQYRQGRRKEALKLLKQALSSYKKAELPEAAARCEEQRSHLEGEASAGRSGATNQADSASAEKKGKKA